VKKQRGHAPLSVVLGRLHRGRPCLSPPCFPINTGGDTKKRRKREGLETERKTRKLREKKRGKRNRRTKKKKAEKNRGVALGLN